MSSANGQVSLPELVAARRTARRGRIGGMRADVYAADAAWATAELAHLTGAEPFGCLLTLYHHRSRLTNQQVSARAGLEVSYFSRLAAGSRLPHRGTVLALARVLARSDLERDQLLVAAGFAPAILLSTGWTPELHQLATYLARAKEDS